MAAGPETIGWGRSVEGLCYLYPPVIGVGVIGVLQETALPIPLLSEGLVLVGSFGYLVLTMALAIVVGLDARAVARAGRWRPRPLLNAAVALLVGPIAGAIYLVRRHRRVPTPAGRSEWWLVVALSLATTLFAVAAAAVGLVLSIPVVALTGVALAGAIAVGVFPVAIYQDAAYVSAQGGPWEPNPGIYLGLAFCALSLPPLLPIVASYYLGRRRYVIGTP